ncbi:MAG: class I SAM-dependent methyltransferase [Candidatus Omnitrophota bacterium]
MNLKITVGKIIAKFISLILPPRFMRNKWFFSIWEKKGYHIVPISYYEPIPDTKTLKNDIWENPSELIGIGINEDKQLELLSMFSSRYKQEYDIFPEEKQSGSAGYYTKNNWFECVDGEIYYSMICHFKPKRIIEIGAGFSTLLAAKAILKNKEEDSSYNAELETIEPYPRGFLKKGFPGLTKSVVEKVENISFQKFEALEENDILFIDSSHVLNIGGDVKYEYLEILPRLRKGVIIHIHDIFLPNDYPKEDVMNNKLFWTEQYLLQAFLLFNDSFEILLSSSYMNLKHPDRLEQAFNSYQRYRGKPSSFWIRRIK